MNRAYAHARVRASKSRLLGRREMMPLLLAADVAAKDRALGTIGIDSRSALFPQLFARLMTFYRTAIRVYEPDSEILRRLLRLHEVENLKLVWRGVARNRTSWTPLWRDLASLAAFDSERVRTATTVYELAGRLEKTPYAEIARRVAATDRDDLAAAELAFDQWATTSLLEEARRLPRGEALARKMIESVAAERNEDLLRRGRKLYGLSDAALQALVETAPPSHRRRFMSGVGAAGNPFIGHTFELAPAIAVILLAEGELRAVNAAVEKR
jgi:vacuolar-type H+-ATPase subunit C/Vma6